MKSCWNRCNITLTITLNKGRGALIDEIGPLSKVRILHQKLSILTSEVYSRSNYTVTVYLSYARADRKTVTV